MRRADKSRRFIAQTVDRLERNNCITVRNWQQRNSVARQALGRWAEGTPRQLREHLARALIFAGLQSLLPPPTRRRRWTGSFAWPSAPILTHHVCGGRRLVDSAAPRPIVRTRAPRDDARS